MNNILKTSAVLYFVLQCNIYSQPLVQNITDIHRLKENEDLFINQPLKKILNEIKPDIKTATVFNSEMSFLICFRFTTLEQQKKREGNISDRVSLFVYVKDPILWNWNERTKGKELDRTVNDVLKYSDIIVRNISIVPANEN